MPYVPVPKDLTKVKTKVAAGLTKREGRHRQFRVGAFDDRPDDALFLLRHV